MRSDSFMAAAILVMALMTAAVRFAPFVIFKDRTPKVIAYLGQVLPAATIAMLVVYCFKDIDFTAGNRGIPELIASAAVIALHKWKHNVLLSILGGTLLYMFLIQAVLA